MQRTALWQHSSNSNNKIAHNSIEHFWCNLSDFFSDDVLSCLWIIFTNSVFQALPSENSQTGWDLGNRMARGYRFDVKWDWPMRSYAWVIQVFCSRWWFEMRWYLISRTEHLKRGHHQKRNQTDCTRMLNRVVDNFIDCVAAHAAVQCMEWT